MVYHDAIPAAEPFSARLFAGLKCLPLSIRSQKLFRFAGLRSIVPVAVFAMVLVSAHASILNITYTDYNSDSASLALTGTTAADGGFAVTNVTGFFDGSAVTGPASGTSFGATSNEFYADPSTLPDPTPNTGFVFETAGGESVYLYEYNVEVEGDLESGFANSVVYTAYYYSGGVNITSISSSPDSPEPATAALGFGALALMAGWRKFAARRG